MSLKRKDPLQPGGLRVAADDPHLVSLGGGGRLSTAVTIHNLPIGDMSIGSSPECGVILNGSGVQSLHCTLYRSESGEVTLVPEKNSRILIDGKTIDGDVNLTQGAMLTIGKSNYLRFNNPAEAQLIKSAINGAVNGNNNNNNNNNNNDNDNNTIDVNNDHEKHLDFYQESNNNNIDDHSPSDDIFKNLTDILEQQNMNLKNNNNNNNNNRQQHQQFSDTILNKLTNNIDFTTKQMTTKTNNIFNNNNNTINKNKKLSAMTAIPQSINVHHSPKVFTADSITVNTPAKDVLGAKYTNFTKNLTAQYNNNNNSNNNHNSNNHNNNINNNNINNNHINNNNNNSNFHNNNNNNMNGNANEFNNQRKNLLSTTSTNSITSIGSTTSSSSKSNGSTSSPIPSHQQHQHPPSYNTSIEQQQQYLANKINNNLLSTSSTPSPKLQPSSACYDRYPKPGSYGSLQVFPMNGVNSEMNNNTKVVVIDTHAENVAENKRHRAQIERMQEQEISEMEQKRLEEILKMCAEFERQNSSPNHHNPHHHQHHHSQQQSSSSTSSSPIVQNRIKTNGSLPRDKKSSPFNEFDGSPNHHNNNNNNNNSNYHQQQNLFFPTANGTTSNEFENQIQIPQQQNYQPQQQRNTRSNNNNSGYENVKILPGRRVELSSSPPSTYSTTSSITSTSSTSSSIAGTAGTQATPPFHLHKQENNQSPPTSNYGYENVFSIKKTGYIPQSPRTKIKTCISPKRDVQTSPQPQATSSFQQLHQPNSTKQFEYDLLVQSFEDKLRMDRQGIRDNRTQYENHQKLQRNITNNNTNNTSNIDNNINNSYNNNSNSNHLSENNEKCNNFINNNNNSNATIAAEFTTSMHNNNNNNSNNSSNNGSMERKNKNVNNLTLSITRNVNDRSIDELTVDRQEVLNKVRQLKTEISELQRQEEEVLRELDIEKALVLAELKTEESTLADMEHNNISLQNKIYRLEAQRNANRVMQETQQAKLKQSIEIKQEQVTSLENLIGENPSHDDALREDLNNVIDSLENDTKTFDDLEFQYLEEETEWLAYREELHNDSKMLTKSINEKRNNLLRLRKQSIDNQNTACNDTKSIERDLWTLLSNMEKYREELKLIDNKIFELTGKQIPPPVLSPTIPSSTSTFTNNYSGIQNENENIIIKTNQKQQTQHKGTSTKNTIMSQSLFGSQEILNAGYSSGSGSSSTAATAKSKQENLMSKSFNENLLFNTIEMPSIENVTANITKQNQQHQQQQQQKKQLTSINNADISQAITKITQDNHEHLKKSEQQEIIDPLLKLKYNLSPPFEHKTLPKKSTNKQNKSPTQNTNENDHQLSSDSNDGSQNSAQNCSTDDIKSKLLNYNLNLSIESDDYEVNPLDKRIPSQDDIDRITKITLDAPLSTEGASNKVIESIKEIERNRQLLLTQQGSHIIEYERQKMNELKKKSHDEARAQYLQLQSISSEDESYRTKDDSLEDIENRKSINSTIMNNEQSSKENSPLKEDIHDNQEKYPLHLNGGGGDGGQEKPQQPQQQQQHGQIDKQRHSHPDFDRQRPLSETTSELSYDALSDKPFKSSNDIRSSPPIRLYPNGGNNVTIVDDNGSGGRNGNGNDYNGTDNSMDDENTKRISTFSQISESGSIQTIMNTNIKNNNNNNNGNKMTSGNRRNIPKHQRPLTRYLPIMSLDLDLRQHIESAGHQVTLCPHVMVDSYSCRGYLHKLGATFHGWSRRWFVLDRQKMALIYYSDKTERKPRGGAYFTTIDEVYLDHLNTSKSGRPHCTFIVKTKKRSYHLQAASDAAARIWIDAIITGAQGNIDY